MTKEIINNKLYFYNTIITNPFYDESLRFEVNPIEYYQLTQNELDSIMEAQAQAKAKHKALFQKLANVYMEMSIMYDKDPSFADVLIDLNTKKGIFPLSIDEIEAGISAYIDEEMEEEA